MNNQLIAMTIIILCLSLFSCTEECMIEQDIYRAETIALSSLPSTIKKRSPRGITDPGKIYFYNDYLLIGEKGKGIHFLDIKIPSQPKQLYFLEIPGNGDMAVKNGILFASQYTDLVGINIQEITNPYECKRKQKAFSNYGVNNKNEIVLGFKKTGKTELVPCESQYGFCGINNCFGDQNIFNVESANASGQTGNAGSFATFAIVKDALYAIDNGYKLNTFDITTHIECINTMKLPWNSETLFPHNHELFIGTRNGLQILDISNPFYPQELSTYSHVTSCDPVVVDDNYAYVTLRSGSRCRGNVNELQVIDITDLEKPQLKFTYNMSNPQGLGLGPNNSLFICDGDNGIKVFDTANKPFVNYISKISNFNALDVIPLEDLLILIGDDGLHLYEYAEKSTIKEISTIKFE